MIPLDRYPKEITLRDDARVVLRPMLSGDTDALWIFPAAASRDRQVPFP